MTYKTMAVKHGVFIQTESDEVKIGFLLDPRIRKKCPTMADKLEAAADQICDEINALPEQWRINSINAMIAEIAKKDAVKDALDSV